MSSSCARLIYWERHSEASVVGESLLGDSGGQTFRGAHSGTDCYVYFSAWVSWALQRHICMLSEWSKDMFWTQSPRGKPRGFCFPLELFLPRAKPASSSPPCAKSQISSNPPFHWEFSSSDVPDLRLLRILRPCLLSSTGFQAQAPKVYWGKNRLLGQFMGSHGSPGASVSSSFQRLMALAAELPRGSHASWVRCVFGWRDFQVSESMIFLEQELSSSTYSRGRLPKHNFRVILWLFTQLWNTLV